MMGWLLINLSVIAKCVIEDKLSQSMILYQLFCGVSHWLCTSKYKFLNLEYVLVIFKTSFVCA